MRLALIGSRTLWPDIAPHISPDVTEIVTGGARGADTCAMRYARAHGLRLRVFYPDYDKHGKRAPLIRNREIVDASDAVLAFWDGESRGTLYTLRCAAEQGKPCRSIRLAPPAHAAPQAPREDDPPPWLLEEYR